MPNGNIHDHPISDVVFWERRVFSQEMDTLLAEIHALAADRSEAFPQDLADRLLMADSTLGGSQSASEVPANLKVEVQALRDRRVIDAKARGVDTDAVLEPIRAEVQRRWSESDD